MMMRVLWDSCKFFFAIASTNGILGALNLTLICPTFVIFPFTILISTQCWISCRLCTGQYPDERRWLGSEHSHCMLRRIACRVRGQPSTAQCRNARCVAIGLACGVRKLLESLPDFIKIFHSVFSISCSSVRED